MEKEKDFIMNTVEELKNEELAEVSGGVTMDETPNLPTCPLCGEKHTCPPGQYFGKVYKVFCRIKNMYYAPADFENKE